jgi:hypothetical protein
MGVPFTSPTYAQVTPCTNVVAPNLPPDMAKREDTFQRQTIIIDCVVLFRRRTALRKLRRVQFGPCRFGGRCPWFVYSVYTNGCIVLVAAAVKLW